MLPMYLTEIHPKICMKLIEFFFWGELDISKENDGVY